MCEIRCNITDSSECGRDLYRSYVLCCIMYLFRCWRKSLRSPLACWMRMVRLHCTRHVWVIGLRMLKSCYNWASIIHPPSLIAFRSTVLLRRQVSGQLTTTCYCYCCCCEGNQNLGKVSHDLWPDNLENVISLSPYVNYNISICVGVHIVHEQFTSYRVDHISMVVAACQWPVTDDDTAAVICL